MRNETLYKLGQEVYMAGMRQSTTPDGFNVQSFSQYCANLGEYSEPAMRYFVAWNAAHPEDFKKFVESPESELPNSNAPLSEEVKTLSQVWRNRSVPN